MATITQEVKFEDAGIPTRNLAQRLLHAAQDASFIFGAVMVALLFLLAAIGPELAPRNPYLREPLIWYEGQISRAPFVPGENGYVLGADALGRDMLSLLLHGARTTIVIATVGTLGRLLVGFLLGTLAGWWTGSFFDRAVTAVTELLAAIPGLILAMLFVFGIGIRSGIPAFVLAVALVGWGEIAQIVRSHVLSIKQELFIDAARAVGLGPLEILSRHVMPNLLSTMLALSALQMGASLLLLGELGFVSVFISGGNILVGDAGTATRAVFEVPDWGAMLGTYWPSFRALPWLPGLPALAFLISILSFNLFGYGLQRFIERGRFYPSGWSVARFFIAIAVLLFGAQFALSRTGPETQYKDKALAFDTARAWQDIAFLTRPELEGRQPGSNGAQLAAGYVAQAFGEAELTPFPTGTYFQTFSSQHGTVLRDPTVSVLDEAGNVVHTVDYGIAYSAAAPFNDIGPGEGQFGLTARPVSLSNAFNPAGFYIYFPLNRFEFIVYNVRPDEEVVYSGQAPPFNGPAAFIEEQPTFTMSHSAARELLDAAGYDFDEIWHAAFEQDQLVQFDTTVTLRADYGMQYQQIPSVNVVGYLPGNDIRVQTQRILVVAPYTGPTSREGEFYPGANSNASGVAVMLEVLRTWQEQDFTPKRTVIFAVVDEVGGRHLADNPILEQGEGSTMTTVIIDGVGAGNSRLARVDSRSGLEKTFDQSARLMRTRTTELDGYRFFFAALGGRGWNLDAADGYSGLAVSREGYAYSGAPGDTLDLIDPDLLEEAGQTLTHYLMVISSE